MIDKKIIEKCKAGDFTARKRLYDLAAPTLFAMALRYMPGRVEAQQVLRNSFIKIFQRIKTDLNEEDDFVFWSKEVLLKSCLAALRKRKELFFSLDEYHQSTDILKYQLPEDKSNEELMVMISKLPLGCRTVFNLYTFEERPFHEIASLLKITEGDVSALLSKSLEKFNEMLEQNDIRV